MALEEYYLFRVQRQKKLTNFPKKKLFMPPNFRNSQFKLKAVIKQRLLLQLLF